MLVKPLILAIFAAGLCASAEHVGEGQAMSLLQAQEEEHVAILGYKVTAEFIADLSQQLSGLVRLLQLSATSDLVADESFRVYPAGPRSDASVIHQDFAQAGFKMDSLIDFLDKHTDQKLEMVNAGYVSTYMGFKISSDRKMTWVIFDASLTKKNLALRTIAKIPRFSNKFSFVRAFGKFDEIRQNLGLEKFPALVGFYPTGKLNAKGNDDNISAFKYSGSLGFGALKKFFELAITEDFQRDFLKGYHMPTDDEDFHEVPSKNGYNDTIVIQTIDESAADVLEGCKDVVCLLVLAAYEGPERTPDDKVVAALREVQRSVSSKSLKVVLMEGTCHSYLLPQIGSREGELPTVAAYNTRTLEYIPYKGKFEAGDLTKFITALNSKDNAPVKLPNKLTLRAGGCPASLSNDQDDGLDLDDSHFEANRVPEDL